MAGLRNGGRQVNVCRNEAPTSELSGVLRSVTKQNVRLQRLVGRHRYHDMLTAPSQLSMVFPDIVMIPATLQYSGVISSK